MLTMNYQISKVGNRASGGLVRCWIAVTAVEGRVGVDTPYDDSARLTTRIISDMGRNSGRDKAPLVSKCVFRPIRMSFQFLTTHTPSGEATQSTVRGRFLSPRPAPLLRSPPSLQLFTTRSDNRQLRIRAESGDLPRMQRSSFKSAPPAVMRLPLADKLTTSCRLWVVGGRKFGTWRGVESWRNGGKDEWIFDRPSGWRTSDPRGLQCCICLIIGTRNGVQGRASGYVPLLWKHNPRPAHLCFHPESPNATGGAWGANVN